MKIKIQGFITEVSNPGCPSKGRIIKKGLFCPGRCQYGEVAVHKMTRQIQVGFYPLICCGCGRWLKPSIILNGERGWIDATIRLKS